MAGFYTALRHHRGGVPLAEFLTAAYTQARLAVLAAPQSMETGAELSGIYVEVCNEGQWTWSANGPNRVLIVHRWLTLEGKQVEKKSVRNRLPSEVRSGQMLRVPVRVRAPRVSGRFRLELTLMQDGVMWFTGSANMNTDPVEVDVIDPSSSPIESVLALRRSGCEWSRDAQSRIYHDWYSATQELSPAEAVVAANIAASWPRRPQVSVVVPEVPAGHEMRLIDTLESLSAQIYDQFQIQVWTGAQAELTDLLCSRSDHRVEVVMGSARMPADALNTLPGEIVIVARCGDVFAPHALQFVVGEFLRSPRVQWVFWDSDERGAPAQAREPRFLASFDPELASSTDWYVRSGAVSSGALGGVELLGTPGSLELAISRQVHKSVAPAAAVHIPFVLQHRLEATGEVSRQLALLCQARGASDQASMEEKPLVSIIILNRDQPELLERCIASIVRLTVYPDYEIIIVDNGSVDESTLAFEAELESSGIATIVRDSLPFSWSRLCNRATQCAGGSIFCFLNNDVEVETDLWLDRLVTHALRPEVGAVGATLWYGNNKLQHGGVVLDRAGLASHARKGWSRWERPPDPDSHTRTVSAVTGACLVTRRDTFEALSGFDEIYLPIGLSDIDYCLRGYRELGLRTVLSAEAELFHRESATRGKRSQVGSPETAIRDRARRFLLNAWFEDIAADPWSSPNRTATGDLACGPGLYEISLRSHLRRYALPPRPKLAFVHVPKTAGVALRTRLAAEYSARAIGVFSARSMLQCYGGDPAAIAAVRQRAIDADVLYSHFSVGFGDVIDVPCVYATVLRDPVERVVSHYAHLRRSRLGPLAAAGLEDCGLEWAVRHGLVPGNLMTRMILGERPEPACWDEIVESGQGAAANFVGFRLPRDVWLACSGEASQWQEVDAQTDRAPLDKALRALEESFAFISTVDSLDRAVGALANRLDWQDSSGVQRRNDGSDVPEVDSALRKLIIEHNQLDMALYQILSEGPGYRIYEERIAHLLGDIIVGKPNNPA